MTNPHQASLNARMAVSNAARNRNAGKAVANQTTVATEAGDAMQSRIHAIVSSNEAKGRESQAQHLALKTTMPVADVLAILAVAPKSGVGAGSPVDDINCLIRSSGLHGFVNSEPAAMAEANGPASDTLALIRAAGLAGFKRPDARNA